MNDDPADPPGHVLDECYNDGLMWRASIRPSALTGTEVECLIPLDEENYEEDDLIPEYYKEVYDRYVAGEAELKESVAGLLLQAARGRGLLAGHAEPLVPDEVLSQFRLSQVCLLERDEAESGDVVLDFYLGESWAQNFTLIVSVNPLAVRMAG
jgi:hypothetical protein